MIGHIGGIGGRCSIICINFGKGSCLEKVNVCERLRE